MQNERASGKVVFLNGASSSGKSALAWALQHSLEEPFWHFSIDHLRDSGVLQLERIQAGEFDWPMLQPAFFDVFYVGIYCPRRELERRGPSAFEKMAATT